MNLRFILLVVLLALLAGVALGVYAATTFSSEPSVSVVGALQLGDDAQADYIANVAEAYAMDGDLNLARDRLARLRDAQIVARVETLALNTANQHNPTSQNLARLAVALGSKIKGLVALYTTATPPHAHGDRRNGSGL